MKIVFFGTPHFAANILQDLLAAGVNVAAVVSRPDRPKGRSGTPTPSPVAMIAKEKGIPLFQPEKASDPAFVEQLRIYEADLFVVVAYGEILRQQVLDTPRLACINVHASLLPLYRGAAPIQHCIIEGATETGVTIMHMVRQMDAGDIITTEKVKIGPNTTAGELGEALCVAGMRALRRVIADFEKGIENRTPQDHAKATYANKIELEDCEVKWIQPAQQVHNLIRGVTPIPGAWCWAEVKGEKKRLRLLTSRIGEGSGAPGEVVAYGPHAITVACGDGVVDILAVQLEGKKAMSAGDFTRGFPLLHLK